MSLTGVVCVVRVHLALLVALGMLKLRVLDVALVTSAVDADGANRGCASHCGSGGSGDEGDCLLRCSGMRLQQISAFLEFVDDEKKLKPAISSSSRTLI